MSQYSPALRVATAILTCAGLFGCSGSAVELPSSASSPSTTAGEATAGEPTATTPQPPSLKEIQATLDRPSNAKAYSALVKTRTLVDGDLAVLMTGRMNFNSEFTAHVKLRVTDPPGDGENAYSEMVVTRRATYARAGKPAGKWRRLANANQSEGQLAADLDDYVRLLLKRGPSAIKGQERFNDVLATRISGRIKAGQIKDIDPSVYENLRQSKVASFAIDLWVGRKGRVVGLKQRFVIQGAKMQNIMTLTEFRGPQTFSAP